MKILLVNNNTQHLPPLSRALAGHQVEMVFYRPGMQFNAEGKDLVILSGGGGEGNEINDIIRKGKLWYEDQMEFVLACQKPVLGICMGFEVICRAYGEEVKEMPKLLERFLWLDSTNIGQKFFGHKKLKQFEAHKWHIPDIKNKDLEVLAHSTTGIEVIRHKKKPIVASQFHPEEGGTLDLTALFLLA